MQMFDAIIAFFQDGGVFMYPIMLVLALGIAIAGERWLFLRQTQVANQRLWTELAPVIAAGDNQRALEMTEGNSSVLAMIISYGLERVPTAEHREEIETAMEEGLMEVMPRLEKRTHYLALFANIATLLGLLRHHHRSDPRIHGRGIGGPSRQGGHAVGQHLRRHEHDGLRPDCRDTLARGPCLFADPDHRNHRPIGDEGRQVPQCLQLVSERRHQGMIRRWRRYRAHAPAEMNITAFMNLNGDPGPRSC